MALSGGEDTAEVGASETLMGMGPLGEAATEPSYPAIANDGQCGSENPLPREMETAAVPPPQLPDEDEQRPISATLPPVPDSPSIILEQQQWTSRADDRVAPKPGWSWSLILLWTAAIMAAATAVALFVMR
jgi:hypothetical protein